MMQTRNTIRKEELKDAIRKEELKEAVRKRKDAEGGKEIVQLALDMGLVPEFIGGVGLEGQTFQTRWRLHVIAQMSKDEQRPSREDLMKLINQSEGRGCCFATLPGNPVSISFLILTAGPI